jgi:DNA-binding NtrC family response regulator
VNVGQIPRVLLVEDNVDAATVLAGTLYLKGCHVDKSEGVESCLKKLNDLGGKVDVVVISHELVGKKDMNLIIGIKKINFDTKILVISNEDTDKNNIIDYGADEFALKPMSPENMADKILMLMAKEATIANRE